MALHLAVGLKAYPDTNPDVEMIRQRSNAGWTARMRLKRF